MNWLGRYIFWRFYKKPQIGEFYIFDEAEKNDPFDDGKRLVREVAEVKDEWVLLHTWWCGKKSDTKVSMPIRSLIGNYLRTEAP